MTTEIPILDNWRSIRVTVTLTCTAMRAGPHTFLPLQIGPIYSRRSGDTVQCSCDAKMRLPGAVLCDAWLDCLPGGLKPALLLLLRDLREDKLIQPSMSIPLANLALRKVERSHQSVPSGSCMPSARQRGTDFARCRLPGANVPLWNVAIRPLRAV